MMDPVERTVLMARAALSPSHADDERTRRAVGLGSNALAPTAHGALGGAGLWAALRASGGAGVAIAILLVGLGFGAGLWVGRRESPVPPIAPQPARASVGTFDAPASAEPMGLGKQGLAPVDGSAEGMSEAPPSSPEPPRPGASSRRHHPAIGSAKPPARAARRQAAGGEGGFDPSDELALLRRVEKSLRNDQPALALALLGELGERFPETRLDEERAAANVLVHCALHDPGSRRRAEEFLKQRASSVYADRIRSSCSIEGASRAPEPEGASVTPRSRSDLPGMQ